MEALNLTQGSAEWHAHRATCWNASDAPAMLNCSPYLTRNQLIEQIATGLRPDVDAGTQRRFDEGHAFEALARPHLAERIIGEELSPVVGTLAVPGLTRKLSASFDGIPLMDDPLFEHKRLNNELREALPHQGDEGVEKNSAHFLAKHYRAQMEQQLLVASATRVLFIASLWEDGVCVDYRACWYSSDAELRAEILAGWKQLETDVAAYDPLAAQPATVEVVEPAAPVVTLPAVLVETKGDLAVTSNLGTFGAALSTFIARIPKKPTTDLEFGTVDQAVKALKKAEDALQAAEDGALARLTTVDELRRTIASLRETAKTARLACNGVVETRKKAIRLEQIARGQETVRAYRATKNQALGRALMPEIPVDFAAAIAGLKKMDSLVNAIDSAIAQGKVECDKRFARIKANLAYVDEAQRKEHAHLFHDLPTLVQKAEDDFRAAVDSRIAVAERAAAEKKAREDAAAEEKRKREEAEAAERKRKADEEAERARQAAEEKSPATEPQASATPPLATEPIASPAPNRGVTSAPVIPLRTGQVPPRQSPPTSPPALKLGDITTRLAPLGITADGLERLGFPVVATVKGAKLYHEADFDRMCEAILAHVRSVQHGLNQERA